MIKKRKALNNKIIFNNIIYFNLSLENIILPLKNKKKDNKSKKMGTL